MTENKPVPTLSDVAKRAGVSTATVSRCLNSPERVIQATRDKVMTAVQELGYAPNFAARVMAAKRSNTIGAIIPTMENAIFARGLQAFQDVLHARGYTLLVASSSYSAEMEGEQIRTLVSRGADGLLLIGHDRDPDIESFLVAQNMPVLVAWTFDEKADVPSIGFDNLRSMQALAEEVIEFGHRRLAMITALTKDNDRARLRLQGVIEAMKAKGLDPDDLKVAETAYGIDNGAQAFEALMRAEPPPTAVMCGNDVLAVGALRRAHALGMSVPGDVSITGFDDIELARIVQPELTTVHVPHREMGRKAADALIDMVERKVPRAISEELSTGVKLRDSLGRPPENA
ncbi:MAG: LacI family DNA-binding transcriptional regulator [Arenibacterium sp.]